MNRKNQSGQALVSTAIAMVVLAGFAGLAIDMGMLRYQKRLQQTAADAAALAGASNLSNGGVQAGGAAASIANGFTDSANGASGSSCQDATNTAIGTIIVTVCNGPATLTINSTSVPGGPHAGAANAANYVEAIVTVVQPTYFMKIFGVDRETVIARAVATNYSGATPGLNAGCMWTLAPPNAVGVEGFNIQGSANLQAPTCGILDNGNYDPVGNSPNLIINAGSFAVSGSDTGSNKLPTCTATPNNCPAYSAPASSDPLAGITAPSQPGNGSFNSSTNTYSPGTFNGITLTGNGSYTFSPGIYYMTGDFTCHGTPAITGSGVMFYFTNGATWNCAGNDNISLSAPTSGTYTDMLFYQNPADTANPSIGGNVGSSYNGILYFPSAEPTFYGNSGTNTNSVCPAGQTTGLCTDVVIAAAVHFFGNPTVYMSGLAGLPAPAPPAFTIGTALLVE
jgi:Flp pilus assembly protein TadG